MRLVDFRKMVDAVIESKCGLGTGEVLLRVELFYLDEITDEEDE